ncbi:hypothetical protein [Alienimonas californiensis]|uniref:Uncharacterized protein n=1 Tax=Alienimonas californiensis TaxID=2527989 RepID=A0A517P3M6_9PLAN|nr:hypothetical protein [Alienimonas californiensis]QDT13974.1 hypothetical protein CA12_00420 [Alienimonas californiensis]
MNPAGPSPVSAPWNVILCEGYHDRAFWTGLLVHHAGAPKPEPGQSVLDPAKGPVRGGRFGFYLPPDGHYVEVNPVGGDDSRLRKEFDLKVKRRLRDGLRSIVYSYDPDRAHDSGQAADKLRSLRERKALEDVTVEEVDDLTFRITDSDTVVTVCPWSCDLPDDLDANASEGVPAVRTLERLICAAYAAAHPERVAAVAKWLALEPARLTPQSAKGEAFSLMAKWHPDRGCESFYESLWERPETREPLLKLLESSEAWPAIQRLRAPDS